MQEMSALMFGSEGFISFDTVPMAHMYLYSIPLCFISGPACFPESSTPSTWISWTPSTSKTTTKGFPFSGLSEKKTQNSMNALMTKQNAFGLPCVDASTLLVTGQPFTPQEVFSLFIAQGQSMQLIHFKCPIALWTREPF